MSSVQAHGSDPVQLPRQADWVRLSVALVTMAFAGMPESARSNDSADAQWLVPSPPTLSVGLTASAQSAPEQAPGSAMASLPVTPDPEMVDESLAVGGGGAAAVSMVKVCVPVAAEQVVVPCRQASMYQWYVLPSVSVPAGT